MSCVQGLDVIRPLTIAEDFLLRDSRRIWRDILSVKLISIVMVVVESLGLGLDVSGLGLGLGVQ